MTAICPAGPPKERAATRSQTRKASPKETPCGQGRPRHLLQLGVAAVAWTGAASSCAPPWPLSGDSRASPPASYASPRWRRGTSGRRHRRAPCPPRAAPGRPHTCATARERRRADRAPPGRGRAGPCRRRGRSWQGATKGGVASPNSSTMTSKVHFSPRWLQKMPSASMSKGVAEKRSATPVDLGGATNRKTAFGSTKRRISHGQAMRSIFGRERVTQTVRPCGHAAAACLLAPSACRHPPMRWCPRRGTSRGGALMAKPGRGALAELFPFWQTTTAARPANSCAHSAAVVTGGGRIREPAAGRYRSPRRCWTSTMTGQFGRPIRRASLSMEMVLIDDMMRPR